MDRTDMLFSKLEKPYVDRNTLDNIFLSQEFSVLFTHFDAFAHK